MADTYLGDCKICEDYTDLIQGICMDCVMAEQEKEKDAKRD